MSDQPPWPPGTGAGVTRLRDLTDVDAVTAVVDGKVLQYDAVSGKFKGVTPAAGGGGATGAKSPMWTPAMEGLLAMSFDPFGANVTNATFGNGEQHSMRVPVATPIPIVNAHTQVHTAGVGMTLARLGVLNAAGTLLGLSGDLSAAFTTTGFKTAPLTAQFAGALASVGGASTEDFIYIAILFLGATTTPRFFQAVSDANLAQANLSGAGIRKHQLTGQTDVGAPVAGVGGTDASQRLFWCGVS